jgi:hypothetical protein
MGPRGWRMRCDGYGLGTLKIWALLWTSRRGLAGKYLIMNNGWRRPHASPRLPAPIAILPIPRQPHGGQDQPCH